MSKILFVVTRYYVGQFALHLRFSATGPEAREYAVHIRTKYINKREMFFNLFFTTKGNLTWAYLLRQNLLRHLVILVFLCNADVKK